VGEGGGEDDVKREVQKRKGRVWVGVRQEMIGG